ncbi:hypothetical protein FRACYDRAFT_242252 [Fragilariopsis cylindrus CCMP1102]|uniref:Uncharacterized protein n=1 Tax=Fragilariopsis cylindrus CCMP1102 TaxID=635003 RepID=A0A1E7F6S3_9STRA|nr:hypothetical protein FRACYDRAFT_242252 [Fragilariopsis cylindrus CCMP1102]|eukprot:OEU13898.1 hypothetical protein FRACYDRAFT_242252 [Fragilariopsis cylindrus CCMP1102]
MMSLSPGVVISNDNVDNDNEGDYNSSNDENNNNSNGLDESFSSFSSLLSSSIYDISKSFDRVLEIGTIHCLPIITMTTTRITTTDKDINDQQGEENEKVQEEEEDIRPYIPFRLSLACEYCGSSSVRDCHVFDPKCRRPETFFPKVKPPFVVAMCGYGDKRNNNNKNSRTYETTKCWSS